MPRRAFSIAFWTETGTSRALPLPMPMRPSPSPTTVSAAKPRIRPPFTTLVTRLIETIFSRRPSSRSSCGACPCLLCGLAIACLALELESAFARGIRQRLDSAVIAETGAVERNRLDAGSLGALGNQFADDLRRLDVSAVWNVLAHLGLDGGSGCQHLAAAIRNDLRID